MFPLQAAPPATDESDDRMPCHFCGRKFAQLRIAMHEAICAQPKKVRADRRAMHGRLVCLADAHIVAEFLFQFHQVRKVHDGAAKRVEGTDFAEFKDHRSETPPQIRKERQEGARWRANAARLQQAMHSGNEWCVQVFVMSFLGRTKRRLSMPMLTCASLFCTVVPRRVG